MKEYLFTGKAVAWVDEGEIKKLIVHCHEKQGKLVIAFGRRQKILIQDGLEQCDVAEVPLS